MNVVLIGYRGTGKSTIARRLALRLSWDWVDADVEIELRAGKSIAAIFADDGEPAFRDWETKVLAELVIRQRTVVALGGGVVLREENRKLLHRADRIVWLKAEVQTILARLDGDATSSTRRPPLTALAAEDEVRQLLAQRTPRYRECAHFEIDTDDLTAEQITDKILDWLRTEGWNGVE